MRVLPECDVSLPVLQRTLLGRCHLLAPQPTVLAASVDINRLSLCIIIMRVELLIELQLATAPVHALGTPYFAPLQIRFLKFSQSLSPTTTPVFPAANVAGSQLHYNTTVVCIINNTYMQYCKFNIYSTAKQQRCTLRYNQWSIHGS